VSDTSDPGLSSLDGKPLSMSPDEVVERWISRLLSAPPLEPATFLLPCSFGSYDYALPLDALPWSIADLLAVSSPLDSSFFVGSVKLNTLCSPLSRARAGRGVSLSSVYWRIPLFLLHCVALADVLAGPHSAAAHGYSRNLNPRPDFSHAF
jgi:hypothetical protein